MDLDELGDGYSFYENRAQRSEHDLDVEAFELARIESGLKRIGWQSRGHMRDAPVRKVADEYSEGGATEEQHRMLTVVPNGMPLREFRRVSSKFGQRVHPIQKKVRAHLGVDFSAPMGTPVHSTANGIVVSAVNSNHAGYGKHVVVRHAQGFTTLYAHLSGVDVQPGEFVPKGALLGKSGNTGHSTGPHLHYEIKYLDKALDPETFMEWTSKNYLSIFSKETGVPWSVLRKQNTSLSQVNGVKGAAENI